MVRKHLLALTTTAFLGVSLLGALPAQALMYSFSFTDIATSGIAITASGTFNTDGSNTITTISGLYNGNAITGPNAFYGADNKFPPLTEQGFSFAANGSDYNVYYTLNNDYCPVVGQPCYGVYDGPNSGTPLINQYYHPINFSANAVPLPAAVWLFGSGLIGLVGIGRRRRAA